MRPACLFSLCYFQYFRNPSVCTPKMPSSWIPRLHLLGSLCVIFPLLAQCALIKSVSQYEAGCCVGVGLLAKMSVQRRCFSSLAASLRVKPVKIKIIVTFMPPFYSLFKNIWMPLGMSFWRRGADKDSAVYTPGYIDAKIYSQHRNTVSV